MSAAYWRKAMNSGATATRATTFAPRGAATPAAPLPARADRGPSWLVTTAQALRARHVVVLALLIAFPFFATPFITFQIGARKTRFEVTTNSVQHPIRLRELREFACPEGL